MKISDLVFDNKVFLAPMAGVTDLPFRVICKEMGCGLVYSEMVSAKALCFNNKNTEDMLRVSEKEGPIAIQIFGNDPFSMAKCCETFNDNDNICMVDINMGCPVPKVVRNGEGAALMKVPKIAAEIVREVKKASGKPVTVKFRKGFDDAHINAVDFAKELEQAGVDAIAIHGRTRSQMYSGKADLDIIRQVKQAVSIPVIGNGDIFDYENALNMFHKTSCDAIMVARGAQGNPWIFREINRALNNEEIIKPTDIEKIDVCIKHYEMSRIEFGEYKANREMRKHICFYLRGMKYSTELKNIVNYENDCDRVIEILLDYKNRL